MFNNILIPIDPAHEDMGLKSIEVAKNIAGEGGRFTILAVLPVIPPYVVTELPNDFVKSAEAKVKAELKTLAQDHIPGHTDIIIKHGYPYPVILEVAEEIKTDLIIITSHKPGWESYLLGSVASKVVDHAHCAVLVNR